MGIEVDLRVARAATRSREPDQGLRRLDAKLLQRRQHLLRRRHLHDERLAGFRQALEA